jgi:hypothetical protein
MTRASVGRAAFPALKRMFVLSVQVLYWEIEFIRKSCALLQELRGFWCKKYITTLGY